MPMIGFDFFGDSYFSSPTGSVRNIKKAELQNGIYDHFHLRERTDIDNSNEKVTWQIDSRILATFNGTMDAGNVFADSGLEIVKFAIKRRKIDEIEPITIGYAPFENNKEFTYLDITQPNDTFIYQVVPVASNDLESNPTEVEITSEFSGYFLVDVETDIIIPFDKSIGNVENVDKTQNKGRVQLDTFHRFPRYIYTNQRYNTFTLSTVLLPNVNERTYKQYERLERLINENKPLLVKGSNGSMYVCEASNLRDNSPKNSWTGHDYITVTLDFTEIMTVEDYMADNVKGV